MTVASIVLDCLTTLKKEIPDLEMAYYKQDNAGCYHSKNSIISAKLAGDTKSKVKIMKIKCIYRHMNMFLVISMASEDITDQNSYLCPTHLILSLCISLWHCSNLTEIWPVVIF